MKLYCVKFKDSNYNIVDVQHMFANNNQEIHDRLDYCLEKCKENKLDNYCSYSFFEMEIVDGLNLSHWFGKYGIEDDKVEIEKYFFPKYK